MKPQFLKIFLPTLAFFLLPGIVLANTKAQATTTQKTVALTFDDGPYGTSTQEVLTILQKENIRATFFLIGKKVEQYPALAKEEVADGEVIGNHTYDHPDNLTRMSYQHVKDELSKTESAIASSTGVHATLFRPPYGSLTPRLRKEITTMGYKIELWNVDPTDWDYASSTSAIIEQRILSHLKSHMIILLHDGRDTHIDYPRSNMVQALPRIIEDLKQRGYTFTTL